ncbi:helix-turn-helix domain-containing protein [Enterococcus sp. AZ126]|uniref:helix-turn-helix domain-containing protein n=1 Tax=Enterococcus sp. AZ126 TaxID=2774635 RepID=UPI003F220A5B
MATFTDRLTELREKENLSKQGVADLLNVNRVTYSNWEYGKTEPNFVTLAKLAKLFNVSVDYLLGVSDVNSYVQDHKKELLNIGNSFSKITREYKTQFDDIVYKVMEMSSENRLSNEEVTTLFKDTLRFLESEFEFKTDKNYFEQQIDYYKKEYAKFNTITDS